MFTPDSSRSFSMLIFHMIYLLLFFLLHLIITNDSLLPRDSFTFTMWIFHESHFHFFTIHFFPPTIIIKIHLIFRYDSFIFPCQIFPRFLYFHRFFIHMIHIFSYVKWFLYFPSFKFFVIWLVYFHMQYVFIFLIWFFPPYMIHLTSYINLVIFHT